MYVLISGVYMDLYQRRAMPLWVHYDFYTDISYFNGIFPQNVTVQSYPANRTTLNTLG